MKTRLSLTVNGESHDVLVPVHKTLLEVLREDLGLIGTKHGCELGECGTCTVLVDGEPVLSCLALPADLEGAAIATVEGMARRQRAAPAAAGVRRAGRRAVRLLHARDSTDRPGAAVGRAPARAPAHPRGAGRQPLPVHRLHEDPRCGRAGGAAHEPSGRPRMKDGFSVIGQPLPKIDAWAKVTGETRYADDLVLPRMAYGKLLRSPHAHARIVTIDTERARALPGVYAVITGHDLPRVKFGILPVSQDEEALCTEKVRMVGDAVAAVAAVDEETAEAACRADRRDLRAAAGADVDPGVAGPSRGADPRVRRRPQRAQERRPAVRRRGRGVRRVSPGARGRLLLRGQHAPADGAACCRRPARRRRQAHALVLDPDAALRPPAAGQDPGHAGRPHPRDRRAGRRRLRRQARPVRPRDRRLQALPAHRPAGEDRLHARGGLLHPPRAPPGADVAQDRLHEGRRHHGQPHPDLARRRGLRLLRRGLDVLHRRDQPGDVQDAGLQVRGCPRLHQQAAVWPQAWSWHPAAALRARMPARQGGRTAGPRPRRPAPAHRARAVHQDRQPPDRDDDRSRRVHRQGRRGLGVA